MIRSRLLDRPYQALDKPLGFYVKPPGWVEVPLGYRKYPPGYRELPLGYSKHIPNALDTPRGYSKTPPRFIQKDGHPQANNSPSLRLEKKTVEQTDIAENFREEPPGYRKMEESP